MESSPGHGRIAVALGSSFLGVYAHSGFLAGLEAAGIRPGKLSGASAGALAGALYAAGLRGERLKAAALDGSLRWSFADAGAVWRLPGVMTSLRGSGLFDGRRTVRHLRQLLGERDLSSLADPGLEIAVTDVRTRQPVIRKDGPLAELVMASCAVPGLFTIQKIGSERYLDGGIACEVPFGQWLDDPETETIITHRIRHETSGSEKDRQATLGGCMAIAHDTSSGELARHLRELARVKGKRLVEVETVTPFPGLFTQRLAGLCHERGFITGSSLKLAGAGGES